MIHSDYIMRLLNNFARGMARILKKKEAEDVEGALDEVSETMHELFGLRLHFLTDLSEQEMLTIIHSGGKVIGDKAYIMAELIREHTDLAETKDPSDPTILPLSAIALRLYVEALTAARKLQTNENLDAVDSLCDRLQSHPLPYRLLSRLMDLREAMGLYADAEDTLHRLMEVDENRASSRGRDFYKRLLELSDKDLKAGDLPRDEVKEGLKQLAENGNRS